MLMNSPFCIFPTTLAGIGGIPLPKRKGGATFAELALLSSTPAPGPSPFLPSAGGGGAFSSSNSAAEGLQL